MHFAIHFLDANGRLVRLPFMPSEALDVLQRVSDHGRRDHPQRVQMVDRACSAIVRKE